MDNKDLCISLANANTEKKVINLLKRNGFWDNEEHWAYYGNRENNFGTIGNQQKSPDTAIVEKIINAVDAVLVRECLRKNIDPESDDAPLSITEAQERFFEIKGGKLSNVNKKKRSELSQSNINIVATGQKSNPSYSIIDTGEGQTPNKMPNTFLSLGESNKLRIPFVQGKFNMGGTGALQFCGRHNMQLIISKRDPKVAKYEDDETKDKWGFTIVRRKDPKDNIKSSTFKYLKPNGKILNFESDSLPLLPGEYPESCQNPLEWGTFIKLYEYDITGLKTNAILDFYYRLSLLVPTIALPVRIYERRAGYIGHTMETTLAGLTVRLDEDRSENVERGFPSSATANISGNNMGISIYVFKKGKKENYARREGLAFTINGQTHALLSKRFFTRKRVRLGYIKDSILIIADCSDFDGRSREDLFMNSRDRLRDCRLKKEIEEELETILKEHEGLKELNNQRRYEEMKEKGGNDKPLKEALQKIIDSSPTLSNILKKGEGISNPFDLRDVKKKEDFQGKFSPTFFKISQEYPDKSPKNCHINKKIRLRFKTDANNDFFKRDICPGKSNLYANGEKLGDYSLNLWNGNATLNINISDKYDVDDKIYFDFEVDCDTLTEPFYNEFFVKVLKKQKGKKRSGGEKGKKSGGNEKGEGDKNKSELNLPNTIEVEKKDWEKYGMDKFDAVIVKDAGLDGENNHLGYDFYINVDNQYLLSEIKSRKQSVPDLLCSQYKYGMVLIGMALLSDYEKDEEGEKDEDKDDGIFSDINKITRCISPFLLPMVSSLGELEMED